LPDGSGIDLMQRLQSNRSVLGIALTGFGMEDDIQKGREAGFRHHLVKPIDLNKLDLLIQQSANASLPRTGTSLPVGTALESLSVGRR